MPKAKALVTPELSENALTVLERRYLKKDESGNCIEQPADMFKRVAKFIASTEEVPKVYEKAFYNMMASCEFLPNSPTLMNAGRELGQLSACFVLPVGDSMEEIFDAIKYTALIHKSGGGTGFSFSRLRPKNAAVRSTQGVASGPISFMQVFDAATETIKQGGTRRGANMGILRVDHPDILSFIECKQDQTQLTNFNISVGITDAFMEAVEKRTDFELLMPDTGEVVETISAYNTFQKIVQLAWKNGEPGIVFLDRINATNPTPTAGQIESTNPCITGETLVAVADGRGSVSIKQLAEEGKDVPVYCINNTGKSAVRMMRNPRLTAANTSVIKVTLDDGNSVTVTPDHRFYLTDGRKIKAKDLQPNMSLSLLTKRLGSFAEVIYNTTHNAQKYGWVRSSADSQWITDHWMIAKYHAQQAGTFIGGRGNIVHHRDFNPLNNEPENLQFMTSEAHRSLHAEHMRGAGNPMTRFPEKNWMNDPEKQQQFRERVHVGAKRSEVTKALISEATSTNFQDTEFRKRHSTGTRAGMAKWLEKVLPARADAKLQEAQALTDLPVYIDPDSRLIMVTKTCEECNEVFESAFFYREVGYCSRSCGAQAANRSPLLRERSATGMRKACQKKATQTRLLQVKTFLDLKFSLKREPLQLEWIAECKLRKLTYRLRTAFGFFNYSELKEEASAFNHRVLSIEEVGTADVYNGTVDEFHNYCIGNFPSTSQDQQNHFLVTANCGEQPLLPYEACNLGSINLVKCLTPENTVDWPKLRTITKLATRFLDNVIDLNKYPLLQIDETTKTNRKIGLGVMGWADLLCELQIPYNSAEAVSLAAKVMECIDTSSKEMSMELAVTRGTFPNFEKSIYAQEPIRKLRNATTTTIAPTGTISILANSSSGVEPLFAVAYQRTVLDNDVLIEVNPIFKRIAKERGFYSEALMQKIAQTGSISELPEIPEDVRNVFVTAHDITPLDHLRIQAAFQKHTDNAVSKTINFCKSAVIEEVEKAYQLAYDLGCKGVTIYRDGSRDNQVLSVPNIENDPQESTLTSSEKYDISTQTLPVEPMKSIGGVRKRPSALRGTTYEMRTGCGPLYTTINEDDKGAFEVFTTMGKAGGCAASQCEAIGRLISLAWRSDVQARQTYRQLIGITCHKPAGFGPTRITSCADAVAKAIELHLESRGSTDDLKEIRAKDTQLDSGACAECGGPVEHEGGCSVCRVCGYSECA